MNETVSSTSATNSEWGKTEDRMAPSSFPVSRSGVGNTCIVLLISKRDPPPL